MAILLIILACCGIGCLGEILRNAQKRGSYEAESARMDRPQSTSKEKSQRTATLLEKWITWSGEGLRPGYTPPMLPVIQEAKPIPGLARSLEVHRSYSQPEEQSVKAMRGGEFIGNRMRYKVKVSNESRYTITDVRVFLISYPTESLKLVSQDDDAYYTKIEPSGFRSPSFDFLPTHDCVQGEISAGVSYVDMTGQPHTLAAKPFVIRSVCDLLIPDQIEPKEFALRLKSLECGEIVVKVTDWTPEEMYEKALRIVQDANFYEVDSRTETKDGVIHARISGLAKGKYTGKSVAVELHITGPSSKKGASCKIRVSGEDQAMILPAIDDLRERLNAWLCPMCSSPLTLENVQDLKAGKAVVCPFCSVSIGR